MNEAETPRVRQAQAPKLHHAVFVSYSSDDEGVAASICSALEDEAIRCWMAPRDVQGAGPYTGQITQAIREARILLLVLSHASNRSKQVLSEVERAAHCQNQLLTFRIEPITPGDDLAYFLGADHWVDGFRPLTPSGHFSALIQHIRALLQDEEPDSGTEVDSDPDASETFAHFRLLRRPDGSLFRLGKGGMGVTYRAIDTVLNRPVALKVIAAELLRSSASKQRFLREAQAAALIHHPHVATIFHFGGEGDSYFYAMEFVDGEDLERYVAKHGPLPSATALRVVLQVAQALEAAHAHRLIHRDIKPGNVMVVANRAGNLDVKLIDFGLAKGTGTEVLDAARITRSEDFVGSPAFASPEQCEMGKLDTRSDIYSLGVTLWYLLSGKRPFSGTVGQVLIAQVVKPPPFDQLAHVPEPVLALLRRMLAKSPDERFQTPEELQTAVEAAAANLASEFGAVPERLASDIATTPLGDEVAPAVELDPVVLTTPVSASFDSYLSVEIGALAAKRYRLVSEEREGSGGRFFHAKDEKAVEGQPNDVGLKLLHPGIATNPALIDLLENEIGVIRQATHPHLVSYLRLEREVPGPWLVREWVHGFLLYDLLRWRQSLPAVDLLALLEPLGATLDFVSSQGLGLVDVSVRKILVACPLEIGPDKFSELARGDAREWSRCRLLLNPLSLSPLLFRSRNGWDRQTIVPASRVLSMTQAQAGIKGSKAVRLYGRLVYELLSGHRPRWAADPQQYTPLPELDQAGNETLRRACGLTGGPAAYKTCVEFWGALKESLGVGRRSAAPVLPALPLPPPPTPTRKRGPVLVTGAIVTVVLVLGVAILIAIRLATSSNQLAGGTPSLAAVTPSTSPAAPTPTASLAAPTPSTPLASPTPNAVTVAQPPVTPATPTPSPAMSITEAPRAPIGPKVTANAVYEGIIHVKNDSATNVRLIIRIGSDLKTGTMTQSGRHGDLVVNFTGVWDTVTLHAVTDEVVSHPQGIQLEPESFTLHFAEDGKSATYECIVDGKTYVADLSRQSDPPIQIAFIYKGTIRKRGETGSGTPLAISFAADSKSGTMTESSKSGDTVVRFNGSWDGDVLSAVTNEVIAKPANIHWKPESFRLHFAEGGKSASYECNSEGHLYEAELLTP